METIENWRYHAVVDFFQSHKASKNNYLWVSFTFPADLPSECLKLLKMSGNGTVRQTTQTGLCLLLSGETPAKTFTLQYLDV